MFAELTAKIPGNPTGSLPLHLSSAKKKKTKPFNFDADALAGASAFTLNAFWEEPNDGHHQSHSSLKAARCLLSGKLRFGHELQTDAKT